ncbi:alpha-ketoglutarate decarboxylase [Croceitalea rosinachiae]|uniref:Alpha-ketoglutarate decarboxylase n=1 Tax=Croceitalea rosinachiae TaxID=3075596 RepID=A0ABU3A6E1_9FLAO|nr:alpha-ketoglutarate decarboxylase [Croceitalea sp. F388]MDT0605739.1 alpha-ketoglutarate decarboxylase [Croceitalea sp. F388]
MNSKSQSFLSIALLSLVFCSIQNVYSQQLSKSDFWQNVRFGGGLGLGFTNGGFNVALSPSGIYQVNENFATGLGLNFNYTKFNNDTFTAYGGSFMNFFNLIPQIQLSAELEQWRVNSNIGLDGADISENYWTTALFLGIGYTSRNVTVGLRYDIIYDDERSIYIDPLMPFIRFYF